MTLRVTNLGGRGQGAGGANLPLSLIYEYDVAEVNLYTDAGSPSVAVDLTVIIRDGVAIYSTSTSNPALDTGTGWNASSTITVVMEGSSRIQGAGGDGGDGGGNAYFQLNAWLNVFGGGGGGGQGFNPGAGGIGGVGSPYGSGLPGFPGTIDAPGAGAVSLTYLHDSLVLITSTGQPGGDGGDAVNLQHDVTFQLGSQAAGRIYGGGGGGGGTQLNAPGAGGGAGEDGDDSTDPGPALGGTAGKAIEDNGNVVTFDPNQSSFDIKGAIT